MKTIRWTTLVLALSLLTLIGCKPPAGDGGGGDTNTTSAAATSAEETFTVATAILCGKCGEVKGSAECCAADVETCECGMHKGSALCCVHLSDDAAGKDVCAVCGHVADAGHVCDENCEKCADCGLHKGSPACCKLKS